MECRGAAWLVIGHLSSKRYDQHISAYAYVSRNVKYQTTSNDRLNRVDRMRDSIPGGPVAFAHSQTYTALTRSVAMNNLPSRFGWLHPRVALATMITLALALFMPAARPATAGITPHVITVSKTALENVDGNGCSLYEALQATFNGALYHECNAGPDANIIIFGGAAAGGTITLPIPPNSVDLPMIN